MRNEAQAMGDKMQIRDATEDDLPEILSIYNRVIATSDAVYTETAATLEDRRAWFAARRAGNFPVLVADDAGISGFASFGDFRPWPGYALTVEHSVYVHEAARRRGVGTALVRGLIGEAQRRGKHVMIGGVDGANAASIGMHRKLGFSEAGSLREVARKFGHWLDLLLMQRML
jgi:phosphinothricin acetyltransferase